ncbi:MAG TPA: hypothetical protein VFV58_18755 [Blastocatellia bacterium]|jgi:hypothetical protein|nr:hypothetical protein [Blastocatellia bacterium]
MKTYQTILFSLLLLAWGPLAAKRESQIADITAVQNGQNPGSYDVGLQLSQAGNSTTWRYTITKTTNRTKDLGHFIVNFGNCGDQSPTITNIVSATVNGAGWLDQIKASEGNTGCDVDSANFVKFDNLPSADTYVIEFTLDDIYPLADTVGWFKSGTSCLRKALLGPGCKGYTRTSAMEADASLVDKLYNDINTYMRRFGFDYTENPNCTGGFGGHIDGVHGSVDLDPYFNKYVFRFDIHIDPVIDGDRCSSSTVDRQRNEMKSITENSTWAKVQGNWDEWQILEWKFKLPIGFQPTSNFCHIHQLKAQDGPNNGSPVITITPRASSSGSNKRIQIIHSVDGANTGKGTIVDNIPLSDFEGEWVQVREEVHYTHDGFYSAKITRISDGKVLIDFKDENIDMWRIGSSYIRNKFGIYRSLAGGRLNQNPVGQSPLLKNESIWITDFRVYEKNSNPNPGLPHE